MKRKRLLFAAIALIAGALNINAQEEDYTSYLNNPDMASTEGWTMKGNWNGPTGMDGYKCLENYAGWGSLDPANKSYSLTQDIKLPSGKYRAESNAFYRYGLTWEVDPSKSYAYFIANTPDANFKQIIPTLGNSTDGANRVVSGYANSMDEASQEFAAGNYKSTIEFALESESQVTFGYEGTHVLKQSWFISGPIKLYRTGDFDYSPWDTQIANFVAEIQAATPLPTNAEAALDDILATYNKTYSSVAEYNEAIGILEAFAGVVGSLSDAYVAAKESYPIPAVAAQALANAVTNADEGDYSFVELFDANAAWLNSAVEEAKAWIEPYAAFNLAKTDIQALYDVEDYEELVDGAHDALGEALAAGDAAETVDLLILATENLKNAGITYAASANPTGDAKFDLTFMLTNPDVTKFWDGTWGIQPEGWYNEQDGGNFQVMQNNRMGGEADEVFMEYWHWNPATSGFVLCQKVTLPEGAYQMTGRVGLQYDNDYGTTTNITFSANDVDGTKIQIGTLQDASIEFINDQEQEVKIGIKAHEGNQAQWIGINKIHLYKIAPKPFVISEEEDYDNTQEGAGDVELTRTIKVGLNSVVLPFQVTLDDIETLGGEGAIAYTVTGLEGTSLKLAEATEAIQPNVPFFLKATEAGSSFELQGKTIVAGDPVITAGDAEVIGTYAAITVPEESYILSGGKFYFVDSEVSLKPTRAYISVAVGEAKVLTIDINDATAIEAIESTIANAQVYDLSGRKVQNPTRGLYINNGKKVLVK